MTERQSQQGVLSMSDRDRRGVAILDAQDRLALEWQSLRFRLLLLVPVVVLVLEYGSSALGTALLLAGGVLVSFGLIYLLVRFLPELVLRLQLGLRLLDVVLVQVTLHLLEPFLGESYCTSLYLLPVVAAAGSNGRRGAVLISGAAILATVSDHIFRGEIGELATAQSVLQLTVYGLAFLATGLVVTTLMRVSAGVAERHARALRDSEQRYRELFENANDVIYTHDLAGNITALNRAGEQATGISAGEAKQMHVADLFAGESTLGRDPAGETDVEVEIVARDGRLRWLRVITQRIYAQGEPVGVQGIGRDITERKWAEAALRESESRFRDLVEKTSDVLWQVNEHGIYTYCSPNITGLLGYDATEVVGKTPFDFMVAKDARAIRLQFAQIAVECRTFSHLTYEVERKDGHIAVMECSGTPVLDDQGRLKGYRGIARDFTERRRAEEERESLYQQLADREQKLQYLVGQLLLAHEEERRRVAYDVHDGLAQLAWAAQQYLEAFASHFHPRSPQARQELALARDLAQRTVNEARRVISGLRPTVLDDFGLDAALRLEVDTLRAEGWQISYEPPVTRERLPLPVETALFRVAQEALANVRKHAKCKRVHLAVRRGRDSVYLEVQDWGEGFEPTAVLADTGAGRRVGLVGMRERVALLGGQFSIQSEPGGGTRVGAEVPLPSPVEGGVLHGT